MIDGRRRGTTIILSSHILPIVEEHCYYRPAVSSQIANSSPKGAFRASAPRPKPEKRSLEDVFLRG